MTSATPSVSPYGIGFLLTSRAGTTLVETMVGTVIAAFGLIGLYVADGQCLSVTRAHREIVTAEHCLEQRTEQFRAATWTQLTTASGVQALLSLAPVNDDALGNHAETITVSVNPAATPVVNSIVVTRDAYGRTAVVSQPPAGINMQNSSSICIDFQEAWTSAQAERTRTRETTTIMAYGGLSPR